MKYQALIKAVKNKETAPVYLFTGKEMVIARMMENMMVDQLVQHGMEQLNYRVFEEKNPDASEVFAVCEMLPLMSERRLVVMREETAFLKQSDTYTLERMEKYFKNPSPTTVFIIYDSAPDKRKKMYRLFKSHAQIVDYDKLTKQELENWIGKRWIQAGKRPSRQAVDCFVEQSLYLENSSKDMASVDREVEKILDFVGDREVITPEDVTAVMPRSIEDNVFKLVDHAMAGRKAEALKMLTFFYQEGESPFGVFSLLIRQIRMMLMAVALAEKHLPPAAIAQEMKLKTFVVQKMLRGGNRYKKEGLRKRMIEAAKLDLMMKTGKIDQEFAVEWFVLKL